MTRFNHNRNQVVDLHRQVTETRIMTELGLPHFETYGECLIRNQRMSRRLEKQGTQNSVFSNYCYEGSDLGVEGDWLASRRFRLNLLPQAYELLRRHSPALYFVTIAHPSWETPIGALHDANIEAAQQWLRRRIGKIERRVLVVGGYEASVSVALNGKAVWAGHFHIVTAGAEKSALKTALKIQKKFRRRKNSKPVTIEHIGNLAKRLGYSTKRVTKRGLAYVGKNGRQQRRKLPLLTLEQIEFDQWLLRLPIGSRTILIGCRLHHGKLRRTGGHHSYPSRCGLRL